MERLTIIEFLKLKFLNLPSFVAAIVGFLYSLIGPFEPIAITLFGLIFCDLITGLIAFRFPGEKFKKEQPEDSPKKKFTSRNLFRTPYKLTVYICGVYAVAQINAVYIVPFISIDIPLEYIASFPMVWTELQSVDENIYKVTGVSFWGSLQKFIPKTFK